MAKKTNKKYVVGSDEWRSWRIHQALRRDPRFMKPDDAQEDYWYYSYITDTFDDHVVVRVSDNGVESNFSVVYTMDDVGNVTLGEMSPVERFEIVVETDAANETADGDASADNAEEAAVPAPALNTSALPTKSLDGCAWRPEQKATVVADGRSYWTVPINIKAVDGTPDEGWTFEGYLSVFNVVDLGKDVVRKGAFARSLKQRPNVKLLSGHGELTGKMLEGAEDDYGLWTRWFIAPTRRGTDDYTLLKSGALDGLSMGWLPNPTNGSAMKRNIDGSRDLLDVDLFEGSLVAFPMLEVARVTAVKSAAELAAMPTAELLGFASKALTEALYGPNGVKSLYLKRVADGRSLTGDQWTQATELGLRSLEGGIELLAIEAKASRAVSSSRQRMLRGIYRTARGLIAQLEDVLESIPDPDPEDDEDGAEGDGKRKAAEATNAVATPSTAEAARALQLEFQMRQARNLDAALGA